MITWGYTDVDTPANNRLIKYGVLAEAWIKRNRVKFKQRYIWWNVARVFAERDWPEFVVLTRREMELFTAMNWDKILKEQASLIKGGVLEFVDLGDGTCEYRLPEING